MAVWKPSVRYFQCLGENPPMARIAKWPNRENWLIDFVCEGVCDFLHHDGQIWCVCVYVLQFLVEIHVCFLLRFRERLESCDFSVILLLYSTRFFKQRLAK